MDIELQTKPPLSIAAIQTQHPERLMKRLCKHWGHKFPVELGEQQASIELPMGICRMLCTDILQVELHSGEEQMPRFQQVVADHLQRMASSEDLVIEWQQV